ncbi:hypothetical protein DYB38_005049 [Aphanomyces astaci]|uniref:Uncharacterized protein n=1 Tax=Aphanomyces astaci TaxID=112090 RepID=A0A397DY19_APHAT|nr:hypothetical protein DYB38_005049 [Aphanomyces astaci]
MALAAESTLGSALEAVDITLKDDDVLYAKHILDAERHRERAQAMARAEHQARSVENAYKRSVHDAMVQYERECAQLKKTMVDDILAELKLLRDNRDGVSLVRKGLARSARSSRANVTYTEEPDIDSVQTLASSSAAEFTTINLSVTSPSPSDNDDDMDTRDAAAVDSADVVMAAPATPPPATSSFSCMTLFSSNFVPRVLSASVLAPSVIYFIYTGSNTAVLTLGAAVVSISLFEFSWLSLPGTLSILFAASAMGVVYALMLARSVHEPIFLIHVGASALIAGVCAGLTPTSFDAAVLLVQVVAFSMAVLNSRFCRGRPNTNCFLLLDSATAMSIVFVPMAVLRMHQHAHVVSAAICLDLVGLLYIPITFRMLMSELGYTPSGQEIAMRYLFIVWGCDTGAYVTGKLLTKRKYKFSRRSKLAPLISPKKDVEGTVGGVALAVAASCVANAGFVVDRQRYKIANDMVFLSNKDQLWLLEAISRGLAKSP